MLILILKTHLISWYVYARKSDYFVKRRDYYGPFCLSLSHNRLVSYRDNIVDTFLCQERFSAVVKTAYLTHVEVFLFVTLAPALLDFRLSFQN